MARSGNIFETSKLPKIFDSFHENYNSSYSEFDPAAHTDGRTDGRARPTWRAKCAWWLMMGLLLTLSCRRSCVVPFVQGTHARARGADLSGARLNSAIA